MAPANPVDTNQCRISDTRNSSPTNQSSEPRIPHISLIVPDYETLFPTCVPESSQHAPATNGAAKQPTSSPANAQAQMEVDDSSNKRRSALCGPKQNLKMCIQSCQSLPPKTRQFLRIGALAIASILAIVAIYLVARLAEHENYDDNFIVQQHMEEKFEVKLGPGNFANFRDNPNIDYDLEKENVQGGRPIKVVKDGQGKAQQFDLFNIQGHYRPVFPHGAMFDVARQKIKTTRRHPANESEIVETLKMVRKTVDADRKKISNKELRFWESGSEPLRLLLVSTWRSGSTFLGQLIQSHPGVFQHFEPLSFFGVRQVRSGKDAFQAQQVLHRLLDCEYDGLDNYLNHTILHPDEMIGHNLRVYEACKTGPNRETCVNADFLSDACKLFPIQLVKTVRMRLNLTQLLLNDEKLRVKVIFLVRDPRATMNSRYSSVKWCSSSPDCSSPETLCQDLQGDLKVSAAFEKLYPDRFLKVRYEDIAADTEAETQKLLNFLGLEFTDDMRKFLTDNTQNDNDAPWSVSRKSSDRISLWKKQLPLQEIHEVQNACSSVLKTLKYEFL